MTLPQEIKNLRLLSHHDLAGFGKLGEGLALQQLPGGRRILWLAHEQAPKDFTGLDVTDPRNPRMVVQTECPHLEMRSNSLAAVGDLLMVAYQVGAGNIPGKHAGMPETWRHGLKPAGMGIYDVSRPEQPRQISFFDCSGPLSRGAHYVWCVDGRYAHMSTAMPDSRPTHVLDDQFYVIVDVGDPTSPREVGRWWLPGTQEGDGESPPVRHRPGADMGFRMHNVNVYPRRPDRAYCGFIDGGVVILDISDMAHPKMITRFDYHPPLVGMTHTVLPLFDRELMIVTDEILKESNPRHEMAHRHHGQVWVMDMLVETNPVMLAACPGPDPETFFARPGQLGAHNIHENQPVPTSFASEDLVFATFLNGGLRVFDVRNPLRPEEVAHFVPRLPDGAANGINDVYVDENRVIYTVDRLGHGLYILELTT